MGSPKNVMLFVVLGLMLSLFANATSVDYLPEFATPNENNFIALADTPGQDSSKLKYPIEDNKNFKDKKKNGIDLKDPKNIKKEVVYDTATGTYIEKQTIGGDDYRLPETKTMQEYLDERRKKENQNYFRQRSKAQNFVKNNGVIPKLNLGPKVLDKLFGSGLIDLRPQGSAEVIFGWNFNVVRNPAFTVRQQRNGQFDFRQKIQFNLTGSIGERFKTTWRYDTEATFDFDNQINLNWQGKEDDIVKNVQLGNVSLPLNSSLIQGGQSLFGALVQLQFGRLMVTTIFTQQRGQTTETEVTGGAQVTEFDIQADNYDVNRHYFLSQFFADNYNQWCSTSPFISSPVQITNVQVWVTNRTGIFDNTRDVLAFMDMGETAPFNNRWLNPGAPEAANNAANNLYQTFQFNDNVRRSNSAVKYLREVELLDPLEDFQLLNNARQLNTNEFTLNPRLGYISLNQALNNDEILSVAFEYTMNGQTFKVGEFAREISSPDPNQPNVLMLKMLKGATITTKLPIWNLMMKNIYSLGSFSVQKDQFKLNVIYADDPTGADLNYIPANDETVFKDGNPLINILNLDKVNTQGEPTPDGVFDFIEGLTINTSNGRIIFPVKEPFGDYLRSQFNDPRNADYYAYDALYDSTKWLAQQEVLKNKFFLRGSYQGSSNSEISLNGINIPQGSVRVTANGTLLNEGTDYIVDYTIGRVKILNTGILNSGAVIKVSAENNNLFSIQQKTLVGGRFDYKIDKDFIIGGTVMHLYERPITPKVNIGEEPLLNTVVGIDGSIRRESRGLTRLLDRLPFISTKEPSNIQFSFEGAKLFPHNPRTIGERGTAFIDDFEASETPFDLRLGTGWYLASTPEGQPDLFPETQNVSEPLGFGYNRARMAWYSLDPIFFRNQQNSSPATPPNLRNNVAALSNHYTREVLQNEVFQNRQVQQGIPTNLPTFDLAYFPEQKGPYNYTANGVNSDGKLNTPAESWGGIMRRIDQNDFEAANIDYVEIWVLDPFISGPNGTVQDGEFNANNTTGGTFYLNLGSVSEDVLRDTRKSFENGLPTPSSAAPLTDVTNWAQVPNTPTLNNAFDADPDARRAQDIGLDGFDDEGERTQFKDYLDSIATLHGTTSAAYQNALNDPSGDNYLFHSSGALDAQNAPTLKRYQQINGQEGNSPLATFTPDGYPITRTNFPDDEDINRDFSLNITEQYYQYKVELNPTSLVVGQNYVTDSAVATVNLEDGSVENVTWYQLRIPVNSWTKRVGNITDFKSIRFARMFLKDFDQPVVLRLAQMQLVRADWRRYTKPLSVAVPSVPGAPGDPTAFSVSTVNIEENSKRVPVKYEIPPGFFRELDVTTPGNVQQNEQSLSVRVCGLQDGDARGVFKTTRFDFRNYKRLRMFIHAEGQSEGLKDGDTRAFIRLGTDLENNYYEYELPLNVTPDGSNDATQIWPTENELNVAMEDFYLTKQLRSNAGASFNDDFTYELGDGKRITIRGLPDMSNVRVIMLGVRNPLKQDNPNTDDGLAKCGEVWFNELRVVEFNNQGGEAATARLVTKLADLGTFTVSGNYQSIGWGGIDKKLNDRNLNEVSLYDIQTSLELGKFFPAKWGLTIPFFMQRGEQFIRPKYNPLNPDILLETTVRAAQTEEEKQDILNAAQDYTSRRSFNFSNIRKNRTGGGKAKPWDVENFNFSYSFQEVFRRNQQIAANLQRTWRGSGQYTFATGAKNIQPFKKIIKPKKWLRIIRDFNFTPYPQSFTVRADVNRYYSRLLNRNNDNPFTSTPILYDKNFTLNRVYDLRWDLTKSLKIDYSATTNARVDEPVGRIDRGENPTKVDTIQNNFINLGRTTNYTQTTNITYTLPLNKIPVLDWVTSSVRYSTNYGWETAPPAASQLGNTIQNSQNYSYTGQFNMLNLYNKIPALRKINQNRNRPTPRRQEKEEDEEGDGKGNKKKKKKKKDSGSGFGVTLAKTLMMLKNASFTYTSTKGIALPGFRHTPLYLGNDADRNAPGWDFVFGSQNPDVRYRMAREGFLSNSTLQPNFFAQTTNQVFNGSATLEPFKDFRVELRFVRNKTQNNQSVFRFDDTTQEFRDFGFQETGSFQIGISTLRTALRGKETTSSEKTFQQFLNNRFVVAQRYAAEDPRSTTTAQSGFPEGYNDKNQNVLISSFLSAYSGTNSQDQNLGLFPTLPFPSIRVNYNGLSRMKAIKKYASSVTLSSFYSSTYNMPQYMTILSTSDTVNPLDGNYDPAFEIRSVTINESFNPLIRIDINFVNNFTTNLEYKSSRNLALSLANYTLVETRNSEIVVGIGYRAKEIFLPFKIRGRKPFLKNDLNIRFDFSIRDVVTITRQIQTEVSTPTQGQRILSIKPQLDYMLNEKLNLRFFYDRRVTTPATSNAFPTAITQGGISLRYTLQ